MQFGTKGTWGPNGMSRMWHLNRKGMSDDQWLPTAHVGTAQTIFDSCLLLYNAKICKDSNWEAAWRHGWYHPGPQELQSRGLWKVSYRCSSQGIVNERDHGKGPKVHSARWFWRIQVRRLLSAWKHNALNAFNAFKKCLSALFLHTFLAHLRTLTWASTMPSSVAPRFLPDMEIELWSLRTLSSCSVQCAAMTCKPQSLWRCRSFKSLGAKPRSSMHPPQTLSKSTYCIGSRVAAKSSRRQTLPV